MEDGRWKMEGGRWKMEGGGRRKEDGRMKMEDGSRRPEPEIPQKAGMRMEVENRRFEIPMKTDMEVDDSANSYKLRDTSYKLQAKNAFWLRATTFPPPWRRCAPNDNR